MELTILQKDIMEFAKGQYFHASLNDYLRINTNVDKNEAIQALKDLKGKRIASVGGSDIENDWICVTNHGYKIMGWV